MNISEILQSAKDVVSLALRANQMDIYAKLVDLQGKIVELSSERVELAEENARLKEMLRMRDEIIFVAPFRFMKDDPCPLCPRCFETDGKAIHLRRPSRRGDGWAFHCPTCGNMVKTAELPTGVTPEPEGEEKVIRRRRPLGRTGL